MIYSKPPIPCLLEERKMARYSRVHVIRWPVLGFFYYSIGIKTGERMVAEFSGDTVLEEGQGVIRGFTVIG